MSRARPLLVFLVAFLCMGVLAGKRRLTKPSAANHHVHMAAAWLDGRLAHEGKPPGYEQRRHDDWGRVYTLELRDQAATELGASSLRGYPCQRADCVARRRHERTETLLLTDGREVEVRRGQIKKRTSTWYVTFPPGPALVMLPLVALWGAALWDVLLTALAGAMIPAALVWFLDRERGTGEGRDVEHLLFAAALALASPLCWVASNGAVWFTGQTMGALFLTLYVATAWNARRPVAAGACLAMAVACRVTPAFAAPFFLLEWWREGRKPIALAKFAAPLAVMAIALMWMNAARFDDPLEFGHRYLEIRWQTRIQEIGMFSSAYLARNLEAMLWLAPQLGTPAVPGALPVRWSQHGMGLLWASPWLVAFAWARDRFPQRLGLWIATACVAAPSLLYQNTGFRQFSYRFAIDYLPMLVVLLAFGGAARGRRRRWFAALVVIGALVELYGAWMWGRAPGKLFVHDPWWPFVALTGT